MGGKSGNGLMGGVKDAVFGKKDPGVKDKFTELHPEQQHALNDYAGLRRTNTDNLAESSVAMEENGLRASSKDAEMQAHDLVAQRGLGNSSVGLNAILSQTRNLGDQIAAARARLPLMKYDLKTQNLNNATRGIQDILNSRTFIQGRESTGRGGGLLGVAMTGAGAYYGGPGGAQAGAGMGKSIANL